MDPTLIKAALDHLNLTQDVDLDAINTMAKVSLDAGYIKGIKEGELDLSKFIDLSLLNEVKQEK
jgi:NitT/TauT family transport system substrate-binding protein